MKYNQKLWANWSKQLWIIIQDIMDQELFILIKEIKKSASKS